MANRWGNNGNSEKLSSWAPKSLQMVTAAMKLKRCLLLDKPRNLQRHSLSTKVCLVKAMFFKAETLFVNKGLSSQSYVFSSNQVWMWELDHKEGWVLKNWCFWTVVLEKTLKSYLDCKEIKLVHPKWNQWSANTLATWCKEPTYWKRPWWWERLKSGGEGGKRGWDGWMASPTRWTWVGACSEMAKVREVWCAASMGSQWVRHNWVTEQHADQGLPDVNG